MLMGANLSRMVKLNMKWTLHTTNQSNENNIAGCITLLPNNLKLNINKSKCASIKIKLTSILFKSYVMISNL